MREIRRRLLISALALAATILIGAVGYALLGGGRWTFPDCLYMALISATTVGYGEMLHGMDTVPGTRLWTSVVILLGVAVFGIAASMLTAFIVESDLHSVFRKKAMRKQIEALSGHVIVCGIGSTGSHVVKEMVATKTPFVAVDTDAGRIEGLTAEVAPAPLLFILGDATEDAVLEEAGIGRAKGLVSALPDDKDNLFLVVSARGLNPALRIVARGNDLRSAGKLRKAGAHSVVSPNFIGGMRLASEMLRPAVVQFLDIMLRDRDAALRIEEVVIPQGSRIAGRSLAGSQIRTEAGVLVLAIRPQGAAAFAYNPSGESLIEEGATLVVLGPVDAVARLRTIASPA